MKAGRRSRTAEIVAAWRAAEALQPEELRICHDPLARYFISGPFRIMGQFGLFRKLGLWYSDRVAPGMPGSIVARTRYIDDYVRAAMADGMEQLVILGAGCDSRAYRLIPLGGDGVTVFEVDHPATQAAKIRRLRKVLVNLPEHVVYVGVDFETQDLRETLFSHGYRKDRRTLFIWEGVTTYLTAEAVNETLAFVAGNASPGSTIIMTFIFRSVIEGAHKRQGTGWFRRALARRGEPPRFGLEAEEVGGFLSTRGFSQIGQVDMASLKSRYFEGANSRRKVFPWAGIAHAQVASPEPSAP